MRDAVEECGSDDHGPLLEWTRRARSGQKRHGGMEGSPWPSLKLRINAGGINGINHGAPRADEQSRSRSRRRRRRRRPALFELEVRFGWLTSGGRVVAMARSQILAAALKIRRRQCCTTDKPSWPREGRRTGRRGMGKQTSFWSVLMKQT